MPLALRCSFFARISLRPLCLCGEMPLEHPRVTVGSEDLPEDIADFLKGGVFFNRGKNIGHQVLPALGGFL